MVIEKTRFWNTIVRVPTTVTLPAASSSRTDNECSPVVNFVVSITKLKPECAALGNELHAAPISGRLSP